MQVHALLSSEVAAFNFERRDLSPLVEHFPDIELAVHEAPASIPDALGSADYVLTWRFDADWYPQCPGLKTVFTPAAGDDWVAADPRGRVELVHGTFHGRLLGESLLGAILFMNRRLPDMIGNFQRREWDRNIQKDCRLLSAQTILIIGFGHIGLACARILQPLGPRIIGVKRDPSRLPGNQPPPDGVDIRSIEQLDSSLPEADHVVVVLPGGRDTDRLLDHRRLKLCKRGACIYNFGRGNAVASDDLVRAGGHIGGAFLDVTDAEPLDRDSPLWTMDNIMITPHSSCIYQEYRSAFIQEVIGHLKRRYR